MRVSRSGNSSRPANAASSKASSTSQPSAAASSNNATISRAARASGSRSMRRSHVVAYSLRGNNASRSRQRTKAPGLRFNAGSRWRKLMYLGCGTWLVSAQLSVSLLEHAVLAEIALDMVLVQTDFEPVPDESGWHRVGDAFHGYQRELGDPCIQLFVVTGAPLWQRLQAGSLDGERFDHSRVKARCDFRDERSVFTKPSKISAAAQQ